MLPGQLTESVFTNDLRNHINKSSLSVINCTLSKKQRVTSFDLKMGAVMSSYTSKRRNRKLRRQMVKKIFCVQKVKKEVLSAEIPVVSSKQMTRKELGSALPAAAKSNVNREAIHNESFVEGVRIPRASSMVIMKELGKQLRHLSAPDQESEMSRGNLDESFDDGRKLHEAPMSDNDHERIG